MTNDVCEFVYVPDMRSSGVMQTPGQARDLAEVIRDYRRFVGVYPEISWEISIGALVELSN